MAPCWLMMDEWLAKSDNALSGSSFSCRRSLLVGWAVVGHWANKVQSYSQVSGVCPVNLLIDSLVDKGRELTTNGPTREWGRRATTKQSRTTSRSITQLTSTIPYLRSWTQAQPLFMLAPASSPRALEPSGGSSICVCLLFTITASIAIISALN